MPIKSPENLTNFRARWHQVYKPSFGELISLGYVANAAPHSYVTEIYSLGSVSGEVAFFGDGSITPAKQPLPDYSSKSLYVNDAGGLTGDITLYGIDTGLNMVSTTLTLNNTTPVALPAGWTHVNSASYEGANNTDIWVSTKSTTGAPSVATHDVMIHMKRDSGFAVNPTMMAAKNEIMVFPEANFSCDRLDGVTITVWKGERRDASNIDPKVVARYNVWESIFQVHWDLPIIITNGEYIRLQVRRSTGGTGDIEAYMDMRHYGIYDADTLAGASALFDQDTDV